MCFTSSPSWQDNGVLGSIFDYISLKSLVLPEGIVALDSYCFENFYCDELTIPKSVKASGNTIFGHAGVKNKLIIKTECILDLEYLNSESPLQRLLRNLTKR